MSRRARARGSRCDISTLDQRQPAASRCRGGAGSSTRPRRVSSPPSGSPDRRARRRRLRQTKLRPALTDPDDAGEDCEFPTGPNRERRPGSAQTRRVRRRAGTRPGSHLLYEKRRRATPRNARLRQLTATRCPASPARRHDRAPGRPHTNALPEGWSTSLVAGVRSCPTRAPVTTVPIPRSVKERST